MNSKTTLVLVVLVVIAGLVALVVKPWEAKEEPAPKVRAAEALFQPALTEVTGYEVKVESQPAFVFVKEDDKWQMTAPISGPAEDSVIKEEIRRLSEAKFVRKFGKGESDAPERKLTGLDTPERVIKMTFKEGKSQVVRLGRKQALSNKTYVQKEGEDAIYLVDGDLNDQMKKKVLDYRGRQVSKFAETEAVKIEVTGKQNYVLTKSEGSWMLESPVRGRADRTKVNSLLSGITNLRVEQFEDQTAKSLRVYGLEEPPVIVTVTTEKKVAKPAPPPPATQPETPEFDMKTRVIRVAFGGVSGENVFARLLDEGAPSVFQVGKYTLTQVDVPLSDIRDKALTTVSTELAQKVTVTKGKESIQLDKSGGTWTIASAATSVPLSGAAEPAAVDDLFKAIKNLQAVSFENEEKGGYAFESPRGSVEFTAVGQVEPVKLVIGGQTPTKTGAYVRNERENLTAVVAEEAVEAVLMDPLAFLNRTLLDVETDRLSKIEQDRQGLRSAAAKKDGAWKFAEPISGDVQTTVTDAIVKDVDHLVGRKVVGMAADAAKFGLDKPGVRLTLTVDAPLKQAESQPAGTTQPVMEPSGPPTAHTVLLSRTAEGKVHAMAEGGSTICEVDSKLYDDLDAEMLKTEIAPGVDTYKVIGVEITGSAVTPLSFAKENNKWVLSSDRVFQPNSNKVEDVISAVRDLKVLHYASYDKANMAEFGLEKPATVVTISPEKGEQVELKISEKGPAGGIDRYATASTTKDRVFVIKFEDVLKFTKQMEDFKKAEGA